MFSESIEYIAFKYSDRDDIVYQGFNYTLECLSEVVSMRRSRRNIRDLRSLRQRTMYYYFRNKSYKFDGVDRIEIRRKIESKLKELKKIYAF